MDLPVKKSYMIFDLIKATTKDSRMFLRLTFSDDQGALINGIMFDCNKLDFEPKKGDMVKLDAVLQYYNGQPQLKVHGMAFESSKGSEAFLPKSKFSPTDMSSELKEYFKKNLQDPWLIKLVIIFFNDNKAWGDFQIMPAAKTMHHAYINGLLEHTLGVVRLAVKIAPLYPHVQKDLLMVGALFHDIGKIHELDISAGFEYSEEGKFLGHLLIGYTMISEYISTIEGFPPYLRQQLLHMLASHHGELEFGSPQVPKTPEGILLHFIDDMDAKLNAVESVLNKEGVAAGGWSNYDRLLERQLHKPRIEVNCLPEETEQL